MKMNRKFLEDLGIEKEVIDKIMAEHGKAIQSAKPEDYEDLKTANSTLNKQVTDLQNALEGYKGYEDKLTEKSNLIKQYETKELKYRIANEKGIPLELAGRLSGETEEELKQDAETLSSFVAKKQQPLPLKDTEPAKIDDEDAAYREMLEDLKLN